MPAGYGLCFEVVWITARIRVRQVCSTTSKRNLRTNAASETPGFDAGFLKGGSVDSIWTVLGKNTRV